MMGMFSIHFRVTLISAQNAKVLLMKSIFDAGISQNGIPRDSSRNIACQSSKYKMMEMSHHQYKPR